MDPAVEQQDHRVTDPQQSQQLGPPGGAEEPLDDWVDVAKEAAAVETEEKTNVAAEEEFPDLLLIFENQRWYVGIGWDAPLITDRPQWSNGTGSVGVATRPPWMDSNWRVDLGGVPDFCDEEGWTYAHNMTAFADFDALGSKDPTGAFVRRRRWIAPASAWPKGKNLAKMVSVVRPVPIEEEAGIGNEPGRVRTYSAGEIVMEDIPGIGDAAPAAPADSSDATSALPAEEGDVTEALQGSGTAPPPPQPQREAGASEGAASAMVVQNVDVYENRNMVNAMIRDFNGDGFAGLASSLREAIDVAVKYARRIPGPQTKVFFTWHHPELNEVSVLGLQFGASRWACRVYVWTQDKAEAVGREDPNCWSRQMEHTSGIIHFRTRGATD